MLLHVVSNLACIYKKFKAMLMYASFWSYAGERQSNINIADGKKNSVILESEAAKMDQVNRAQG